MREVGMGVNGNIKEAEALEVLKAENGILKQENEVLKAEIKALKADVGTAKDKKSEK
jgi:hypothetical protein